MTQVQQFLRDGNSLRQLAQKYNIQCNICSDLNLVALNYTNLSPMEEPIVKECRGLFLELDSWDIACKSFTAFEDNSDISEDEINKTIDWSTAKLVEKLDGALICLYYYNDEWCIGMRMCADGSNQVTAINGVPTTLSFAELTKETIEEMGYKWEDYISDLNPDYYYSLELCSPETRYGVVYTSRKLVLLGVVNSKDLSEININTLKFPKEKAKEYPVKSLDDVKKIVNEYDDPLIYEGFILIDGNYNRYKFKNRYYIQMMSDPTPDNELEELEQLLRYVITFGS